MTSNNHHSNSIRRHDRIFGFFTFSFFGAAIFSCIVTNDNHCGVKQGSCEKGLKCSVCETENNGCIPISQDAGSVDGKSCEYEVIESSSSSTSSTGLVETSTGDASTSSSSDSTTLKNSTSSDSSENSSGSESGSTEIESFCGDGNVDPDEECDDGENNKKYEEAGPDNCTKIDCKYPICGDGKQNLGEECDLGKFDPENIENDCSPTCQSSRFIFVTSAKFYGNFEEFVEDPMNLPDEPPENIKGINLANWHCNNLANKGVIIGNFIALLGNTSNASLEKFDWKFRLPGANQTVAINNGYAGLINGELLNTAIVIDEKAMNIEEGAVWTGFIKDDKFLSSENNCKYWTSKNVLDKGAVGVAAAGAIDYLWLALSNENQCSGTARLYCVQI